MSRRPEIRIEINVPMQETLSKIRSSTEREILPFVSASRYPQQRDKEFVSRVLGNRVRIWKVPSSSRSRQNISVPYLTAEVVSTENGCVLRGGFRLHPFSKLLPLLPLGIAGPVWLLFDESGRFFLMAASVTLVSLLAVATLLGAVRRLRRQEESDIIEFLSKLFPYARQFVF